MKKYLILILLLTVSSSGFIKADEIQNSYVEFPYIVFVGQVVNITPMSIIISNTYSETNATQEHVKRMVDRFSSDDKKLSHGFANALKIVTIENDHMNLNFYLDNITRVFHQDVGTYMKFMPLLYLFKDVGNKLIPDKEILDLVKKYPLEFYLSQDMVKDIMKKVWLVGVFSVNTESGKLVYHASRYYSDFEKMESDEFAQEYMVPQMVKKGLAVSVSIATYTGNEKSWFKNKQKNSEKDSGSDSSAPIGKNKGHLNTGEMSNAK